MSWRKLVQIACLKTGGTGNMRRKSPVGESGGLVDGELKQYALQVMCLGIGGTSPKSRAAARMLAEAMRHGAGRGVSNSGERYQSGRGLRDPWFDPERAYVVERVNIADGVVLGKLYLPAWMGAEEAREVWEQSIAAGE